MKKLSEISKFEHLRLEMGLSQRELSEKLGVCWGTICRIETVNLKHRRIPSSTLLLKFKKVCKKNGIEISIDEVLSDYENLI